ncbi:hypothetical protein FACS1894191_2660 [Clostridia bacterium]|nr:hypothetical protein FACS1894191_2660 [Clostridia bacterium]
MLKSMLCYLLIITTAMRFLDIVYLFSSGDTNLPISVIIATSAIIIYGVVLLIKRFTGNVRINHFMAFYLFQAGIIVFNLVNVAIFCPLHLSFFETLFVGSFLDLLIDFCAVYACFRHRRSEYRPFIKVVGGKQA